MSPGASRARCAGRSASRACRSRPRGTGQELTITGFLSSRISINQTRFSPSLQSYFTRLIDGDHQFSAGQRQRRVRVAAEWRTPVDVADGFRLADVGYVENHHAGVDQGNVGSVAMRNRAVHVKMLAGKWRPIRRRLLAFLRAGNPPPARFFRICWVRKIRDQIGALFDARQHRADVRVLAVGEPHAMHALAGKF